MSEKIVEICENLKSPERRPKIDTLNQLQRECENRDNSSTELMAIFDECYLHLLRCYSDRFESVRELAVQTVTNFIERLPPNDFHLLNIVATLADRMGQQETIEDSEELRLIYVVQLHMLIQHYVAPGNVRSLKECGDDIVSVLIKALRDSFPAVQREACACVQSLANLDDIPRGIPWEQLAKSMYGVLNHKHSMARIAAVSALGRVAIHVDASGEALSRLLMEVSPLLMDSMPLVRRECGQLGVNLLLELRDRYSYFDRIIPLVLCCLKDDSPEVREYIRPLWMKCGQQYYDENEAELNKKDLADVMPPNYPEGVQRPTIGCRGLVQRSLRLLILIMRESSDWKENVRIHSFRLLYQFVLHAEAAMTAKFFEIYPDVSRGCSDTETSVANEATKAADLMGRLLSYEDWFQHGIEGLEKHPKLGYLKCFYYMFTATECSKLEDISRVAKLLSTPDFSQSLKPELQMYVIKMMETLSEKSENDSLFEQCNDECLELVKNIYIATIKVMALSFDSEQNNAEQLQQKGNRILKNIADKQQISVAVLHEKYFNFALDDVENLDVYIDSLTEPIMLLNGLVNIAKFRATYLDQLQTKLNLVFKNCTDDAKVKIFTAISIAALQWHKTIDKDVNESAQLLKKFITCVVEPHLEWRAGANAEAMRSLATATLCAMSQGAEEEARQVLPTLAKYMPNLIEDRTISTRHYAVKCMFNFGELTVENLRNIAYCVLQRMDDPSTAIRALAVSAISKLCPKFETVKDDEVDYDKDTWETFIQKALDMLYLHYEGPEVGLKMAIKSTIIELTNKYPKISKNCFERTIAVSYNCEALGELSKELTFSAY